MKPYPSVFKKTVEGLVDAVQFIVRERDKDVRDWNNLQFTFISGRKVARIPTGSADVIDGDRVGDVSFQDDYVYYLYNNAGTAEWRRIAAGAW